MGWLLRAYFYELAFANWLLRAYFYGLALSMLWRSQGLGLYFICRGPF
jgi:hypothetical protein